jgi:hypothetical protein
MPSWGRWGAQDERGALKLLGPDDVLGAVREIRTGQILSLAGADNRGVEACPSSDPECQVPMHVELLRGHGIYLAELLNLRDRRDRPRDLHVRRCPLPLVGGVGSPIVPIAVL